MRASILCFPLVFVLTFAAATSIAPGAEHPPATRLKDQVLVAERPNRASLDGTTATSGITRGYEAIYFSIDSRGASRRVVYDTAQKKMTRVDDDPVRSVAKPIALSDRWAGLDRWRRHFEQADKYRQQAIEKNAVCLAAGAVRPASAAVAEAASRVFFSYQRFGPGVGYTRAGAGLPRLPA